MRNKLFLIAGHNNSDPGAITKHPVLGSKKESELAIELRDMVKSYFESYNHNPVIVDDDNQSLSKVISEINNLIEQDDIMVDLHFNAFNGRVSGTEVIVRINAKLKEKELAKALCKSISKLLDIPNRGVKDELHTARGSIGILQGEGNRVLVEICFMDNPSDLEKYIKNKHLIANEIAIDIEEHI